MGKRDDMRAVSVAFGRTLLREVHREVKERFPEVNLKKDAWVYSYGRGQWEFHGPGGFYHIFQAETASDARAVGWAKWLEQKEQAQKETEEANLAKRVKGAIRHERRDALLVMCDLCGVWVGSPCEFTTHGTEAEKSAGIHYVRILEARKTRDDHAFPGQRTKG